MLPGGKIKQNVLMFISNTCLISSYSEVDCMYVNLWIILPGLLERREIKVLPLGVRVKEDWCRKIKVAQS